MKSWLGNSKIWVSMVFFLGLSKSVTIAGETSIGILPVIISAEVRSCLNDKSAQLLSSGLLDYLANEFSAFSAITKLSREHVLLLVKELPDLDPECLKDEAYKVISSKERLHYLVQCSTGRLKSNGTHVEATLKIIILDGINGKIFWEKDIYTVRQITGNLLTEKILLDEVYLPSVNELMKEIKNLKF